MIFHFPANETHFPKKGCTPGLILKVMVFGTWKWPWPISFQSECKIRGIKFTNSDWPIA